jgi:hypothetical protein
MASIANCHKKNQQSSGQTIRQRKNHKTASSLILTSHFNNIESNDNYNNNNNNNITINKNYYY